MKGKFIIGFFTLVWACILTYITFISKNPYMNTIVFFFGFMFTICGFAYGCEQIEKQQK
jgi:arginine exporter protein ArgO